ncbi:MAG: hypothetical protein LBH05_00360 [Deferribacteraceae bacterium]|jgi:hypothetical protein|nr:hypothetical protein [Deferribacteraceae bacterium]
MDVKINSSSEIVVYGNIKNVNDYQEIKRIVTEMLREGSGQLNIKMPDSFSITSSIIGYFLKLVYQDGIKLSIMVSDERLFCLMNDLRLTEAFNVQKVTLQDM